MAALFLIVLVVAWVAICLPAATRARERGPVQSTALFRQGLDILGSEGHADFVRTLGRPPTPQFVGPTADAAVVRQMPDVQGHVWEAPRVVRAPHRVASPAETQLAVRQGPALALGLFVFMALASAVFALLNGVWELHLAADAVLAIYVSWLLEDKHRRAVRRRKVRSIQAARRSRPEPLRAAAGER